MSLSKLFDDPESVKSAYDGLSSGADNNNFPTLYTLSDAMQDMRVKDIADDELIMGVDGNGDPLTVDLSGDNPHVMVSAGTGGCKSSTLRAMGVQALLKGYQVVILDIKRHSHMWAENLPDVHIARNVQEVCKALQLLGEETHMRNRAAEAWIRAQHEMGNWDVTITDAPVGKRTVVLYEEMNSTHSEVVSLTKERFKNSGEYEAVQGFKDSINLGRAVKIHFLCVGQYMNGAAMGKNATEGTALRENFSTRVLSNYSPNAWNMLAWDCGYPLSAPPEKGRGYMIRNGKAMMIQLMWVTEQEAHETVAAMRPKAITAGPSAPVSAPSPTPGISGSEFTF